MNDDFRKIYVRDVFKVLFGKTLITYANNKTAGSRARSVGAKPLTTLPASPIVFANIQSLVSTHFYNGIYVTLAVQLKNVLASGNPFFKELSRLHFKVS